MTPRTLKRTKSKGAKAKKPKQSRRPSRTHKAKSKGQRGGKWLWGSQKPAKNPPKPYDPNQPVSNANKPVTSNDRLNAMQQMEQNKATAAEVAANRLAIAAKVRESRKNKKLHKAASGNSVKYLLSMHAPVRPAPASPSIGTGPSPLVPERPALPAVTIPSVPQRPSNIKLFPDNTTNIIFLDINILTSYYNDNNKGDILDTFKMLFEKGTILYLFSNSESAENADDKWAKIKQYGDYDYLFKLLFMGRYPTSLRNYFRFIGSDYTKFIDYVPLSNGRTFMEKLPSDNNAIQNIKFTLLHLDINFVENINIAYGGDNTKPNIKITAYMFPSSELQYLPNILTSIHQNKVNIENRGDNLIKTNNDNIACNKNMCGIFYSTGDNNADIVYLANHKYDDGISNV